MNRYVEYYDVESDSVVTKKCLEFSSESPKSFSFLPVDEPVKFYKTIVIDHPLVFVYGNEYRTRIDVSGYQYNKKGNVIKTETRITIECGE
jgi:hypothetical protein